MDQFYVISSAAGGSTESMGALVALEKDRGSISDEARSLKLLLIFDRCFTLLVSADFLGWLSGRRIPFSYAMAISLLLWVLYEENICLQPYNL